MDFALLKDCVYKCFCILCPDPKGTNKTVVRSMLPPSVPQNNNYISKSDYSDLVSTLAKHTNLQEKFDNGYVAIRILMNRMIILRLSF
jgi:hypothetical protein